MAAAGAHAADHLHVTAIHFQIGNVRRIQAQLENTILVVERKIGHNIGLGRTFAVAVQITRLRRQVHDLLDRVAELVFADRQPRHQLFVVFFRKFVEVVGQDFPGQLFGFRQLLARVHLQQQALLQVARTDPHRLQLVDHPQDAFELLLGSFDAETKGDVVRNG